MEKFSKVVKEKNKYTVDNIIYSGDYITIKSKDGWEYVSENDCVIAVPHLLDFNELLIRKEDVPPFKDRHPNQDFFITMISGTIEDNELPINTMIRELQEEAGILLNTTYMNYEKWGEFFFNKANSSKCHIYYLPLRVNDFQKVIATTDGSLSESKSKTIRLDVKYLDSLKPSDLLSAFCIEKMKHII